MTNLHVIPRKEPNPKVIEMAEQLLADAKAGEIVDVCWCGSEPGGLVRTGISETENALLRLAAVSRLLYLLQTSLEGSVIPVE